VLGDALEADAGRLLADGRVVVGTIAVLQVLVSWISYRFPRARPVLEGEPIIVVQDGELIERNVRRERLTVEEIAEEARRQQIAHLSEVRWAILETSGNISFIRN
jgi:uncharacterized membrane protein YcaP (DUF421 family)